MSLVEYRSELVIRDLFENAQRQYKAPLHNVSVLPQFIVPMQGLQQNPFPFP